MDDLISAKQAAGLAGVDRRTVTRWVEAGKLTPAMKLGDATGAYLFRASDVEALALARSHKHAAAIGEHAIDGHVVVDGDELTTVVTGHAL